MKISSTPDEGRFPPGTLLGQRYRISNRLGKGGMGEVYKAADLLLGQTVALKFLPDSLLANGGMLERFRNEVRLARQVSHPNVCRVYDIGEADGQPFLSMEFIDGEDLASLLRRIGHPPEAKSLELARKLCAGLAAAHEKGVLHRDFKPANIMIDGSGQVVITDFGLAVAVGDKTADPRSGTPAYMSPEQLAGAEIGTRSDLYALGLVLYEMFAGQHPYASGTRDAVPPPMRGVDPAVEAVILRCLNADPGSRPPTALAVAAALPGGDPVAAALAAGETPTPGMVAASGSAEAMKPKVALACFACLLVGILVLAWVCGQGGPFAGVVEKSPEAMSERAREMLAQLGYREKPLDSVGWYGFDYAALGSLANLPAADARRRIADSRTPGVYFSFRSSPVRMVPQNIGESFVGEGDPPLVVPEMTLVRLDPQGRLRYLSVVPPARDAGHGEPVPYEWSRLLELAGLDIGRLTPVAAAITPKHVFDTRGAWIEKDSSLPLRLEAAAWRGRPVWFTVAPDPIVKAPLVSRAPSDRSVAILTLFWFFVIGATSLFAYRNLRMGRADARGTIAVAVASAILGALSAFPRRLAFDVLAYDQMVRALVAGLFFAFIAAMGYVALEPFIRRRWPDVLISWTRAWRGEVRDPLVGRDLLLGLLSGVWLVSTARVYDWISGPAAFNLLGWKVLESAVGLSLISPLAYSFIYAIGCAFWAPFLVVLAVIPLRKRWLAICVTAGLFTLVFNAAGSPRPLLAAGFFLPVYLGFSFLALGRYGMVGLFGAGLVYASALFLPLTLDTSAWYFNASLAGMLVLAGLGYWAFRAARAGRGLSWE